MERLLAILRTQSARLLQAPRALRIGALFAALLLIVCAIGWWQAVSAPVPFPSDRLFVVREGVAASVLGEELESAGVVRSSFFFHGWMRLTGADREIHAGSYYFAEPLNLFEIASRIRHGERGIESVRVTLTEGMTSWEMGEALAQALPDFDADEFTELARPYEGYLFPDTYFIDPGTTPEEVVVRLRATFEQKTEAFKAEVREQGRDLSSVVIMASIIEKEADTAEDRRLVSGILWNRIEEGMPLQVDAVFGYILGRSGYAPSGDDLAIDSPYNTYLYPDLPPGPIANPGMDALQAALYPTTTDYFYYLTGRDGFMYYAHTFDAHKENRALYLD